MIVVFLSTKRQVLLFRDNVRILTSDHAIQQNFAKRAQSSSAAATVSAFRGNQLLRQEIELNVTKKDGGESDKCQIRLRLSFESRSVIRVVLRQKLSDLTTHFVDF